MQGIEIWNALLVETYNLGVDNQRLTESGRLLDNTRIALGPIISVHRVEAHPAIANMDLQPVAVMFQLMRPAGPVGGCLAMIG